LRAHPWLYSFFSESFCHHLTVETSPDGRALRHRHGKLTQDFPDIVRAAAHGQFLSIGIHIFFHLWKMIDPDRDIDHAGTYYHCFFHGNIIARTARKKQEEMT
jgi:hypothetical protein